MQKRPAPTKYANISDPEGPTGRSSLLNYPQSVERFYTQTHYQKFTPPASVNHGLI
ncbi:hypothetical protein ABIB62_002401 [Mucilaginibacter sp. UYP25]|uniref:hypothetical protein n=1 Tax=unclassified Mucilaginibacter TaxID=2617802 RepID=UPI003394C011